MELITLTVKNFAKWICIHSMPLQLLKKRWRILEWTSKKEDLNRIGVIYGVGIGGIHTF